MSPEHSDGLGNCELKYQSALYDIGSMFCSPVEWNCELVIGERERDKVEYLHHSTKLDMIEGASAAN